MRFTDGPVFITRPAAERKITIDAAMAYATCQNHKLQLDIFKANEKPNAWQPHDPDKVRRELRSKGMDTSDPLFLFIGEDAYERRGGGYGDDLFNEAGGDRVLKDAHLVENAAREMIEFQMIMKLREFQDRDDLSASVTGYVVVPDLRLHNWGTQAKLKEPEGFAKVERYEHEKVWKTIRNNAIDAQILVGINGAGELVAWPRIVFVPKEQKQAVDPSQQHQGYVPPTPEEQAAEARKRGVTLWSRRLAIGPFAGTPLEGRAFYPDAWEDRSKPALMKGVQGCLVSMQIFVPDTAIAAAVPDAEQRYDRELAEQAERAASADRETLIAKLRHERLSQGAEPAVVVIDGQAWMRAEDGSYAAAGDEEAYDSWSFLMECTDPGDIGDTFDTVEAFDQAMAAAADANATDEVTS